MITALLLPRLGETMEQGRVVHWLKRPGDSFVRGETIVEIETDKTVVELPALADGVLRRIDAEVGTDVDVGAPLGAYDAIGTEAANEAKESPLAPTIAPGPAPAPSPAPSSAPEANAEAPPAPPTATAPERAKAAVAPPPSVTVTVLPQRATPSARRLARRAGISLVGVTGTGRRGRIQGEDVEAALPSVDGAVSSALSMQLVPAGRMAWRDWPASAAERVPVLLLHGYGGDSQAWAVLANRLQRRGRRVVAPDLPSHGATEFDRADPASMAEAVLAFVDAIGLERLELVGHSLGAAVAVGLATRLGARVERLTLIAPAGLGSEIDGDFIDGMAHVSAGGGLAHLLRRIAVKPPSLSAQQLDAMAREIGRRAALPAVATNFVSRSRQQLDIGAELAATTAPTRIVWGLEDRIIPWHHASRAGPAVPVFFIPGAGHMPHWDQPEAVAALLA